MEDGGWGYTIGIAFGFSACWHVYLFIVVDTTCATSRCRLRSIMSVVGGHSTIGRSWPALGALSVLHELIVGLPVGGVCVTKQQRLSSASFNPCDKHGWIPVIFNNRRA